MGANTRSRGAVARRLRQVALVAFSSCLGAACGASKVIPIETSGPATHAVRTLAVTPDDALTRAVGAALAKQGYTVATPDETRAALATRKAGALELLTPEVLAALADRGIDAVVAVDGTPGITGHLQKATVTMISTRTTRAIAGIGWRNAWGGAPGSPADAMMRKGIPDAAEDIARALSSQVPAGKP